jgi:N-6 DNA Methylase
MSSAPATDWRKEFGIERRGPPALFSSLQDIDEAGIAAPLPHALRRAFEELQLDGILCLEQEHARAPIIYFRQVERIDASEVTRLHRLFWNQGVAPLLVLIAQDQVHVYSGLVDVRGVGNQDHGLVERLNRVNDRLQTFILSVESGEYFHLNRRSFDPRHRVDRDLLRNLQATRDELGKVPATRLSPQTLDALLCRLVFTCYLFDRQVIDRAYLESLGIHNAAHLRDILDQTPRTKAKEELYILFEQLGRDFNGDLFSDDLIAEARQVKIEHIDILGHFFLGTDMRSGQQSFWPYDFSIIPIETISAIYEHFLKAAGQKEKKASGAFFTPRFLAELVLDITLDGLPSLLDKRFLDPACGSGIFLVGLFNRMAEEWRRRHPDASYLQQVKGLLKILHENIFGVDSNETACRITAFSLYLAFLDQLLPPDIRELQRKGKVLPRLVYAPGGATPDGSGGTIRWADFFTLYRELPEMHFVIGNPPWASVTQTAPATSWCAERHRPFPDRQIATAFIWKATEHVKENGKICFVLPHGTLFNHSPVAINFQREWFCQHAVELVMNLVDYQRFLFEESEAPALVVRFRRERPTDSAHRIDYWAPKTDRAVTQAELMRVLPQDRSRLTVREVLDDLQGDDAPLIWKERLWATPRDWRLLDRLSLLPRLRALVGSPSRNSDKRWMIAQGFEERQSDSAAAQIKRLALPTSTIIEASSPLLRLFLLEENCEQLPSREVMVRQRSNTNIDVYRGPHVLVTKGLKRSAFVDFDVVFRHALRGICGPHEDRDLLLFLAAYLQTALARFFLFHTSSNWGVSRAEVHVEELLRLPFPLPDQSHNPKRCRRIVQEVAQIVTEAADRMKKAVINQEEIVTQAITASEELVREYFDVDDIECSLITDTDTIIIPSVRPTRARQNIPTIQPTSDEKRAAYTRLLCDTLNSWANDKYQVHGKTSASVGIGIGLVVLERTRRKQRPARLDMGIEDVLAVIGRLQQTAAKSYGTLQLVRGLKVFDRNLLYITKPLGQRFWTNTTALNDADEIAASILMQIGWERT